MAAIIHYRQPIISDQVGGLSRHVIDSWGGLARCQVLLLEQVVPLRSVYKVLAILLCLCLLSVNSGKSLELC